MTAIRVRRGADRDWPAIRAALAAEGLPTDDLAPAECSRFLVAETGSAEFAGAVAVQPHGDLGLLRSLVVVPAARGQGLAKRLVADIAEHSRRAGIAELWLLTIDADGFFAGIGFRRVDRGEVPAAIAATPEFADLCPGTAVLMRRDLAS